MICTHTNTQKHTIECVKEFCFSNNIICLSSEYYRSDTKLHCKCVICCFEWFPTFGNLKNSLSGCPKCKKCINHSLEYVISFCLKRNICYLDNYYNNNRESHNFECFICSHKWKNKFAHIHNREQGCRKCSGNLKYTIEEVKTFYKLKNIICKTNVYKNIETLLDLSCDICQYNWKASFSAAKHQNQGCPKCGGVARHTIEYVRQFFNNKGFELLTDVYKNNRQILQIKCIQCSYLKETSLHSFNINKCYYCFNNSREEECRKIFQNIFNLQFPRIKPLWLRNNFNNHIISLELDGYCDKHKLCFEYQGEQHYYVDGFFIRTDEELNKRKHYDKIKKEKCEEIGVLLIEIPYYIDNLKTYIFDKLSGRVFKKTNKI